MTIQGPKIEWLNALSEMLKSAEHPKVVDRMLCAFMWACWPEWYEQTKEAALQWLLEKNKEPQAHA